MGADTDGLKRTKVYTTTDGQAVIEQANSSVMLHSAEQILAIIYELRACLHACYDYCAAWKDPTQDQDGGP